MSLGVIREMRMCLGYVRDLDFPGVDGLRFSVPQ